MAQANIGALNRRTSLKPRMFMRKYIWFYILLIPAIVYFVIFKYLPMVGLVMAFKDISIAEGMKGIFTGEWVGLKHFYRFFNSPNAWRLIRNTLQISLLQIVWGFPIPIILAIMMSEVRKGRVQKTIQTISYLPHFISWVVASGLVVNLLTTNGGVVNEVLKALGKDPIMFLGNPKYFRSILVVSNLWKEVGWNTIIYVAAITSVDESLYEAAYIDGASRFQQVIHITIPSISFIIAMMFVLQAGSILDAGFEQIFLLYSEAVYEVGDIIDTYVYRAGLQQMDYSYATAVGLFKSVVSLIVVVGVNAGVKKLGYEGIW